MVSSLPYTHLDHFLVAVILPTENDNNDNNKNDDEDSVDENDNDHEKESVVNGNDKDMIFEIGIGLFSIDNFIAETTTINDINDKKVSNEDDDKNRTKSQRLFFIIRH